jgi:hypothetical protein
MFAEMNLVAIGLKNAASHYLSLRLVPRVSSRIRAKLFTIDLDKKSN